METDTTIYFDFCTRLNTARFARLRAKELFNSVCTDGNYLFFEKTVKCPWKLRHPSL